MKRNTFRLFWTNLVSRSPNVFHGIALAYADRDEETNDEGEDDAVAIFDLLRSRSDGRLASLGAARRPLPSSGFTALAIAIETRRARVAERLLEVDPGAVDVASNGEAPMDAALRVRDVDVIAVVDAAKRRWDETRREGEGVPECVGTK